MISSVSALRSAGDADAICPRWGSPPRRSLASTLGVVAFGAFLLLVVPYFVPVRPSVSESYFFGFNNKAAVALWVLFSLGFAYWRGPLRIAERSRALLGGARWPLWAMLLLATALHVVAWMCCLRFGPLGEAVYLMDRLQHLAAGQRVFRDFEMAYGAALLYLPLWLSRLFRVSLLSGYCLALLIEQEIGILLIWYVVQTAGRRAARRNTIFVVLALTCLAWVVLVPAQYTSLRYWLAPAIAVGAYQLGAEKERRMAALCLLVAGFGITLLVSQEQAFALLFGVVLFAVLFRRSEWRSVGPGLLCFAVLFRRSEWRSVGPGLLCFVVAAAVMSWTAYRMRAFETMINIGLGGYAVPIGPAPILLPVLPLLLVAACVFVEAIRRRSEGSLETLLVCLSVFSLSAAFGRFDAVHLLGNTFTATVVGWLAVSRNDVWWRRFLAAYLVIVFVFPTQLPMGNLNAARLFRARRYDLMNDQIRSGLPTFYSPMARVQPNEPGARLPFNFYTGRFFGTTNLITARQAEEFVEDLRAKGDAPVLVLPMGCVWGGQRRDLMMFNQGLYYPRPRNRIADLHAICDELDRHYERVSDPGLKIPAPFYLVRRKANAQ